MCTLLDKKVLYLNIDDNTRAWYYCTQPSRDMRKIR